MNCYSNWFVYNNIVLIPAIFGENAGPLLQFTFFRNPGAAFSLGTSTTWVFTILAFVIAFYIYRTGKKVVRLSWAICLGAMLGGAIGNLIDRLFRSPGVFRGAVVDFIQIPYWAIFNIADMGVSISALILVNVCDSSPSEHYAPEGSHKLRESCFFLI